MTIIQYIYLYLVTIPVFFIIDLIWLGVVARGFYQTQLGQYLGPVNWPVAITFYLVFIIGILFFAVVPALTSQEFTKAILYGALFGFFTYATYDLTNQATIKDWPFMVTIIDIIWGTFLSGSVATISYLIGKLLFY